MDLRTELRAIKVPTTVILGRHDPVIDDENRQPARREPAPSSSSTPRTSPNVEQPDAFVRAVG